MLTGDYPQHDMNIVFEMIYRTIEEGGTDERCEDETRFLEHLFAGLPAQAVEYAMMFIHGEKNLPKSTEEIMPLYIRLMNLLEYREKIELLRDIPQSMTEGDVLKRKEVMDSLETHERFFGKPLLGYKISDSGSKTAAPVKAEEGSDDSTDGAESKGRLLLMNSQAAIFACSDPFRTAVFYETHLGFKAQHLDDETMPHIKLSRDNIAIILVKGTSDTVRPLRMFGIRYDMYIYCSEPFLLYNELRSYNVKIIEELPDAEHTKGLRVNRQFVFEDIDKRHICVSQLIENIQ